MVRLTKRPAPPKQIKSEDDYRSNPNLAALKEDCYGKCYICENDKPTTINVEHRVPHKGNKLLKYDWQNLFLSCGHCNNIKSDNFENILDPVKCDPEDFISLSMTVDSLTEAVTVAARSTDESVLQTAELLSRVYNGGTTDIKEIECANLRNAISECLRKFYQYINGYKEEPELGYGVIIKKEISRSSAFAAFKRKIIRDDTEIAEEFLSGDFL